MKKLTLVTLISGALSTGAFAGAGMDKNAAHASFNELDNDSNGYISKEEAKNGDVKKYFSKIDENSDNQLTEDELNTYMAQNSRHIKDNDSQTASVDDQSHDNQATTNRYDGSDALSGNSSSSQNGNQLATSNYQQEGSQTASTNYQTEESTRFGSDGNARSEDGMETTEQWRTSNQGAESSQEEGDVVARNEFDKMDSDRDGQLSKDEASRNISDSFEDIDEDGDELITRVEFSQYRQNQGNDYEDEE